MTFQDTGIVFAEGQNCWLSAKVWLEDLDKLKQIATDQKTGQVMLYLIPLIKKVPKNGITITHKLSVGPAWMNNRNLVKQKLASLGK